jgi:hypothetical protein
MKIILAALDGMARGEQANITYPAEAGVSGDADETIDAPDGVAQRLLAEGLARLPDTVPSTHSELDAVAAAEGIDLVRCSHRGRQERAGSRRPHEQVREPTDGACNPGGHPQRPVVRLDRRLHGAGRDNRSDRHRHLS